jgi:serine/threonine protein phosphatase 1
MIYAVGDIHGEFELLEQLMVAVAADARACEIETANVIFVGDYVDRGPDSNKVIARLMGGFPDYEQFTTRCLLGNHEQLFLDFVEKQDAKLMSNWLRYVNGGEETLRSYGLDVKAIKIAVRKGRPADDLFVDIPVDHLEWLRGLDLSHETDEYFFVHAGILPGVAFDQQHKKDLIWIREAFLDDRGDHGKIVVHGHTPKREAEIKNNRINVDTGACFWGTLTAVALQSSAKAAPPRLIQVSK